MKLEAEIAGGIALWDATGILPQGSGKYRARRKPIDRLIIHHSGALGSPGINGIISSAMYVVAHRGWPGFAYTFWVPYHRVRDDKKRIIVYRGNEDVTRSFHTSGSNERGVAVCLQGNLTNRGPTRAQVEVLEALIPWAFDHYGFDSPECLTWHSEIGRKKSCPGAPTVKWLTEYREAM